MKPKQTNKKRRWPRTVFFLVLALVCIGGAELLVCRWMDPALYARLTAPVRQWWGQASAFVGQAIEDVGRSLQDIRPPEPAEPDTVEDQSASEPAIAPTQPPADPAVTTLVEREGRQVLTGGVVDVIYYQQSAPEWADKPYGRDSIGRYGCGPTAMAMAVSSLAGQAVDPAQMAQWAVDQGCWAPGSGSRHSIVNKAGESYGFSVRSFLPQDADDLLQQLASGKIMVALMSKGHFTQKGHFILLRGATLDGQVLVADPNSPERSLMAWDPQIILDELSASRDSGAPLWLLSPAS